VQCREDLISYYEKAPEVASYVVEAVRQLSHDHDFAKGLLVIPNAHNVDGAFLKDATRYLGAALLQFLAHSYLDSGGYITWAEVTRYYSRYFGVTAFTRLLGYATLWLPELKGFKRGAESQFWVVRADEVHHEYLVGLRSDILKVSKKLPSTLPYGIPGGSGSHRTTWMLLSEMCKSWDQEELLKEAALPTPEQSASFLELWGSYEERMMEELQQRSRLNYLNEETGYFFGELDGVNRWRPDGIGWWYYYPNPISESVQMEYTYEYKMAWSTIRYIVSILARTPARNYIDFYLELIEKAPANEDMKAQMLSELHSILEQC
jgi:hypothetical protein